MAELKTKATTNSVKNFLNTIDDEQKRADCFTIVQTMETVTKSTAKMWGNAIIGFGDYTYKYPNGKTMDWFMMGFSPRKQNIALYILGCAEDKKIEILSRFGKHKTGKSCIYVNKLKDVNMDVFKELCEVGYQNLK